MEHTRELGETTNSRGHTSFLSLSLSLTLSLSIFLLGAFFPSCCAYTYMHTRCFSSFLYLSSPSFSLFRARFCAGAFVGRFVAWTVAAAARQHNPMDLCRVYSRVKVGRKQQECNRVFCRSADLLILFRVTLVLSHDWKGLLQQ